MSLFKAKPIREPHHLGGFTPSGLCREKDVLRERKELAERLKEIVRMNPDCTIDEHDNWMKALGELIEELEVE